MNIFPRHKSFFFDSHHLCAALSTSGRRTAELWCGKLRAIIVNSPSIAFSDISPTKNRRQFIIFIVYCLARRVIQQSHPVCNTIMLFGVITCLVSVILLGIDGQFVDSDTYPKVSQKVNRTLKPPDVVGGPKLGSPWSRKSIAPKWNINEYRPSVSSPVRLSIKSHIGFKSDRQTTSERESFPATEANFLE